MDTSMTSDIHVCLSNEVEVATCLAFAKLTRNQVKVIADIGTPCD